MLGKIDRQFVLELLIVLIVINYMVITIIFHDFAPLKYSRDLILVGFALFAVYKRKTLPTTFMLFAVAIFCFLIVGFSGAYSQNLGVLVFRKYAFPLMLLMVVGSYNIVYNLERFLNFLALFMGIAAAWGIFQAHVLGDAFLRKIGYQVRFSYGYGADMLNDSFYFGGLGIQRVVSTISNSNVCGLIFGMSMIFLIVLYDYWNVKYKKLFLAIIALGYILTFSRSNFLAMAVVFVLAIWPRLKCKKKVILSACVIFVVVLAVGVYQGESGVLYKIYNWVDSSLQMRESSAAGRTNRWGVALKGVLENPFGVGLGYVGTIAGSAGVPDFFICENSYLALALDFGWAGALVYVSFLFYLAKKNLIFWKKNKYTECGKEAKICLAAGIIVIYHCIVMFFSNHIYDMESMSVMFIFVGIALCQSRRTKKGIGYE